MAHPKLHPGQGLPSIGFGAQLGANAVIGVRYDATEIAQSITEVLCYGTAVVVEQA